MRVVLVTRSWPDPPTNGEAVIVHNLIKYLQHIHELHLITLTDNASCKDETFPNLASAERIHCSWRKSMVGYIANLGRLYPYGVYAGTHQIVGNKLCARIQKIAPDLVQLCSLSLALYERYVPKGVPKILLAADSLSMVMTRLANVECNALRKAHLLLNRRKAEALERDIYPRFNSVVLVSDVDARAVARISPKCNLKVINNGVDVDYFRCSRYYYDTSDIGIVGNFGYPPNERAALRLFEDILPRVQAGFPDVKAYAIGLNPSPRMIELGRGNNAVIITGYVDDIRPYLERLSIFVAFIESGGGIKNKVLEAMSMGLPVVGTSIAFEGIRGLVVSILLW